MIVYGEYQSSKLQKLFLLFLEALLIYLSYNILFHGWGDWIYERMGMYVVSGNHLRYSLMFTVNVMIFLSYIWTIVFFVKRKISWLESINIALAFGMYYIVLPLLGYNVKIEVSWVDWMGFGLVIIGLSTHLVAEYQRYKFKKIPENANKLLTQGLWQFSRHINYFADFLWVSGYAIITRNWWSAIIVIFVFVFFYYFNIPIQDKYLSSRYGHEFEHYKAKVKSFIPFIL